MILLLSYETLRSIVFLCNIGQFQIYVNKIDSTLDNMDDGG